MPKVFTKGYLATAIDSLGTLEGQCNSDEANLTAKITALELATQQDGAKLTKGTYEEVDASTNNGPLSLVEYQTDVDQQAQKAIHATQGEEFLFAGKAFVGNDAVNVLVFRKKAED